MATLKWLWPWNRLVRRKGNNGWKDVASSAWASGVVWPSGSKTNLSSCGNGTVNGTPQHTHTHTRTQAHRAAQDLLVSPSIKTVSKVSHLYGWRLILYKSIAIAPNSIFTLEPDCRKSKHPDNGKNVSSPLLFKTNMFLNF